MRDKSIVRGDLYKKLRQLGMNLPKAVKTVKRYERGDISIIEILSGIVTYVTMTMKLLIIRSQDLVV